MDEGVGVVFAPGGGDGPGGGFIGEAMGADALKAVDAEGFGDHGDAEAGFHEGEDGGDFRDFLHDARAEAVVEAEFDGVLMKGG